MNTMTGKRQPAALWTDITLWVLICLAASAVGYFSSRSAPVFYAALSLPTWAPPAGVFGPVWMVLYVLMGIAAGLVWHARNRRPVNAAITLFVVQLVLNAAWSWLFFTLHSGLGAFVDIVLLWFAIGATAALFWRIHRTAAVLLLPYWLWVSFATALCWAAWTRNPALLG